MKLNYEPLSKHIQLVDYRNSGEVTSTVLGISIDKEFMPSVANVIGTDLSRYKLISKGLFACNPMHVGRDERLPIALYEKDIPAIVSPAYFMFEIIDRDVLNEEYLMMWFRRLEFDRECWFMTDGSVRGGITWDDLCRIKLPVPSYERQCEIVESYRAITDRIALKRAENDNLEAQTQALFDELFLRDGMPDCTLSEIANVNPTRTLSKGCIAKCYRLLGDFIQPVDERNRDLRVDYLLGVSISKQFIPSIANIVGTDLSNYKIVRTGQFAYGPVTSRNGEKISIALLRDKDCIISSSYTVFEVVNKNELDSEYLMLWFSRPEFDRYARYMSHGSVREIFDWDELCKVELPVPSIDKQRSIVRAYQNITERIELKRRINDNLSA